MTFSIRTHTILAAGLLAGCAILAAPGLASAAAAEFAAAAPATTEQPHPGYVVFFMRGPTGLSPAAAETVRLAADAARANNARVVRIVGRADRAEAVKAELVRLGVAPDAIVLVGSDESRPLVKAADGMAAPTDRKVVIAF